MNKHIKITIITALYTFATHAMESSDVKKYALYQRLSDEKHYIPKEDHKMIFSSHGDELYSYKENSFIDIWKKNNASRWELRGTIKEATNHLSLLDREHIVTTTPPRKFITNSLTTLCVWDTQTMINTQTPIRVLSHNKKPISNLVSLNSNTCASTEEKTLSIWDTRTNDAPTTQTTDGTITSIAALSENILVILEGDRLTLFDTKKNELRHLANTKEEDNRLIKLTKNSFLSYAKDKITSTIHEWNIEKTDPLRTFRDARDNYDISDVAVNKQTEQILKATRNGVYVWDLDNSENCYHAFPPHEYISLACNNDGLVAVGRKNRLIQLWDHKDRCPEQNHSIEQDHLLFDIIKKNFPNRSSLNEEPKALDLIEDIFWRNTKGFFE